jgi:hypothetical protein
MVLRPLLDRLRFFSLLIHTQPLGVSSRGMTPSPGRHVPRGQHKQSKRTHRRTSLEWDSNPRPQCLGGRVPTVMPESCRFMCPYMKSRDVMADQFCALTSSRWRIRLAFSASSVLKLCSYKEVAVPGDVLKVSWFYVHLS